MISLGGWNTWGLNGFQKQNSVLQWTTKNNLDIIGILETKLQASKLPHIGTLLKMPHWHFLSNSQGSNTCRIIVGWNPYKVHVTMVSYLHQWLTVEVSSIACASRLRVTFVYALNSPTDRRPLWNYLEAEAHACTSTPWLVLGDFNAIMVPHDRVGENVSWPEHRNDFPNCIHNASLIQVPYDGMRFTWHNGRQGDGTIQKKLDWVFMNQLALQQWPGIRTTFQPRSISDHSAMIMSLSMEHNRRFSGFKFLKLWIDRPDFLDQVERAWQTPVRGDPWFQLTTKLRVVKANLQAMHFANSHNISDRVRQAKREWDIAQANQDGDPLDAQLRNIERDRAQDYAALLRDEESFFKQRSRIQWLQMGDRNTGFFHKTLIHRQSRNSIHKITTTTGETISDHQAMGNYLVDYYRNLLAPSLPEPGPDDSALFFEKKMEEPTRKRLPAFVIVLGLADNLFPLTIKGRLRTMDRLHDRERPRICTLCSLEDETHEHLFFNCRFSHEVWAWITTKHKTPWPNYRWPDLIQWGAVTDKSKSLFSSLIARLTLAASVYSIWMKRNQRVFKATYRSARRTAEEAHELLRTYLLGLNLQEAIQDNWFMP
ncbi:hypothetical protein OIU85_022495 [Salix viminalis]|uniref:Reverse transcriptase zinc-binding domain-containing protein n=1 Tax=Salix viminalis TaxID=40686 RepID=A0A9Q0U723_SALVM|nr:hypothetical protein OIU85_022495 [Salix viminalis]